MVQAGGNRRPWAEAASSAFAVASALPSAMNSEQIADLFEKIESGAVIDPFPQLPPDIKRNSLLKKTRNMFYVVLKELGLKMRTYAPTGETFLIAAARTNNVHAVRKLTEDLDVVDETDNEGWTALLNAAHKGHVDVVRILLEAGASVDLPDMMGWSPLMWAVYKCHPEAHVNLIDEEDGLTPLIVASGRGFTSVVEKLLAADAQVNACDKFGSTALIWAARKGHLPIVQMLLNAGAEVDAVGMGSSTALMLATKGNYLTVVDLLLTREPNVNVVDQNGLSALGIAAREGYADICESLINSGAFVNQSDKYGNWILISAVRSGNANIVRLLLEKFADVNARDSENRTALHLAIDKSFMDIVYIILERKPNLELKNKDGETPLLRAVKSRHVALCDLLVKSGAKISAADNNGDNALHLALRARSRRLTQTLLANPSDSRLLYRPNRLGQTPYSIDNANPQPILPLIFGPIDAEQQMDTMLGYDVYSNVLADIGFLYYGSEMRGWSGPARVATSLSRFIYRIRLLWNVATLYAPMHSENDIASNPVSLLVASVGFIAVFLMLTIYPLIILLRYGYTNVPRKRVNEAARSVHKLRFEGLMQKLQSEVDILADMIRSLDAFTRSQTRLVVVVDGLDNCEQERMVQTLDALELLFSARKHRPFITIIAVDPHIIVSAINHNMHSALTGTELTGHDYLKNIVNMPLYLHNSALRQLQNKLKDKRESLADWKERYRRQDTFHGSHLSLADGRQSRKNDPTILQTR
ncbi:P-loop domain protein, KAP family [Ancylostoma duodenale]|uniref:p-loop domain protein, KAP family n=1 Tax=Ancylostoma duodenale TaxID=51022 RepID=A0A0C2GRM4_9BILA|nr:P-loop domain protein, KAP family [Ancylostoma duodenale]